MIYKMQLNEEIDFRVILLLSVFSVWILFSFSHTEEKATLPAVTPSAHKATRLPLKSYFIFFPLNINLASVEELTLLPGIGNKYAEAIVSYREQTGRFSNLDQLKAIQGIGKHTLDKIRPLVTL